MRHPPYQLRTNKAIDRFLLIECASKLLHDGILSHRSSYYGFGGPTLEDLKIVNYFYPNFKITSIEKNEETYKRQLFHRFNNKINIIRENFSNYLNSDFNPSDSDIIWVDYTDCKKQRIDDFCKILELLNSGSLVKITIRAAPTQDIRAGKGLLDPKLQNLLQESQFANFSQSYDEYIPHGATLDDMMPDKFPILLLAMFQIACEKTLQSGCGKRFAIISSTKYNDQTAMLSLTGIITDERLDKRITKSIKSIPHANQSWERPKIIDVPTLSIKEIHKLESILPQNNPTGKSLLKKLGYYIDSNKNKSLEALKLYSYFHRYYPVFIKMNG